MATGFGHASCIGFADESTFGTGVTPTHFFEMLDESMAMDDRHVQKPTARGVSHARKCDSKAMASGDVSFQVAYTGLQKLFKHALGSSSVTGSGPYTHVISLSNALPTSFSLETNRNSAAIGTSYFYHGCQIQKMVLSQQPEDFLQVTFSIAAQDEIAASATSISLPTFTGVEWQHCTVSINAESGYKVRSFEIELDNALATDRHQLGNPLIPGFGRSDKRTVKWKCQAEFDSGVIKALHAARTMVPFLVQYTDGTNSFEVLIPNAVIEKADGLVAGSGPLMLDLEGMGYLSSAQNDEIQITIINATAGPD